MKIVTITLAFIAGVLMELAGYQDPKGTILICTAIILVYMPEDKS